MALHAVENVEEAFGVTREFLTPINIRRWLKLALVVFFVGSGVSFPTAQFNTSTPPGDVSNGELPFSLPVDVMTLIVALVAAGILFGGLFALIGAIMEFVLIESLRTGEVTPRRHWRRRWRQGLRLFGFRIAIGLPMIALFAGWLALLIVPILTGRDPTLPATRSSSGSRWWCSHRRPVRVGVGAHDRVRRAAHDSGRLGRPRGVASPLGIDQDRVETVSGVCRDCVPVDGRSRNHRLDRGRDRRNRASHPHSHRRRDHARDGLVVVDRWNRRPVAPLALLFGLSMLVIWTLAQVPVVTYLRYYALLVLGDIEETFHIPSDRQLSRREP